MPDPIRVLQVFGRMDRGGAEVTVMNVFRNIDRQRVIFDFVVHTEDKCAFDDEIYQLGGRIFRVPAYRGKNHFTYKEAWNCLFKEHPEYRIIHGRVRSTGAIYLKIAKRYGLVTIAHSHSTSSGNGIDAVVKNILQLPIRNIADYLFACSKPAGEWLFGKKACTKENFYVVKNAIATEQFLYNADIRQSKRKELQISDSFVIGHVGRFHPSKNHGFLIDVFNAVRAKNDNAILLLVGNGNLRKDIEKKVRNLGLSEYVIFAGTRSDVSDLLQAMDVFVFPSLYEGFPISLIEAQTSGLISIISSQISHDIAVADLVEAVSLEESAETWAKRILRYASGYDRTYISNEIAAQGYDIKSIAKWMQEFFISLNRR